MKRLPLTLCLTLAAGLPVGLIAARPIAAEEAGPRVARFKGVVKTVDARTGRFIVPVNRGRDGDPAPTTVDVLIHTAASTRFFSPGGEGRGPVNLRLTDLGAGQTVYVRGTIQRDGSVAAQEVTVYRRDGGAEGGFRDGEARKDGPREGELRRDGPRDGERPFKTGPRDGERPFKDGRRDGEVRKDGPRDGEFRKDGPRDGDLRKAGPRDGEFRKDGPRDGERPFKTGPRDGDVRKDGPREGDGGKAGGEGANADGFFPGRVKAIDVRRNAFLFQYRIGDRGNLQNLEAVIFVTPTTRLVRGREVREGGEKAAATFRDIQVGAIVQVQASRGPDGFYASEIRISPPEAKRDRGPVEREGEGRKKPAEGEGQRSPESDRKP